MPIIKGLVPAVVQNSSTGQVLMLAYMNQAALSLTMETGQVHFYSRSRQRIWKKGETSGHVLLLKGLLWDCDEDALLIKAYPEGPTCHTGSISCFSKDLVSDRPNPMDIIPELTQSMLRDKDKDRPNSYSQSLMRGPVSQCAKKVVEEAGEVAVAVLAGTDSEVIYEAADLIFHLLIALLRRGITFDLVNQELSERWKNK